jgi:hypothetical protein
MEEWYGGENREEGKDPQTNNARAACGDSKAEFQ